MDLRTDMIVDLMKLLLAMLPLLLQRIGKHPLMWLDAQLANIAFTMIAQDDQMGFLLADGARRLRDGHLLSRSWKHRRRRCRRRDLLIVTIVIRHRIRRWIRYLIVID